MSLPPENVEFVFPWAKDRAPHYTFLTCMLVGQFVRNLMMNFISSYVRKHNLDANTNEELFEKVSQAVASEAKQRCVRGILCLL